MRKGSAQEDSATQPFKVSAAKFPVLQLVLPLIIAGILSSLISIKLSIPLICGFLIGAVILAVSQFFRSSFELKGRKLSIKELAIVTDFHLDSLVVESDTAVGPFKFQDIIFRDKRTELSLLKLGSSRFLSAEGMLLLAALQRQGAFIDVLGFGQYTRGLNIKRQTASPTIIGTELIILLFGAYSLLMNGMILYFRFLDEQMTLGRSSFFSTFITPIGIPAFYILSATWVCLAIFLIIRANESRRDIFPFSVDMSENRVKLLKRTKVAFDLKIEEIKLVRVTAHDKGIDKDAISVEIETHYARKYKLLEGGMFLPIGVSNFLEHARRKGVTVVYQKLRKGSDVPEVIWEAKAEKAAVPIESGQAQDSTLDENQLRQTRG